MGINTDDHDTKRSHSIILFTVVIKHTLHSTPRNSNRSILCLFKYATPVTRVMYRRKAGWLQITFLLIWNSIPLPAHRCWRKPHTASVVLPADEHMTYCTDRPINAHVTTRDVLFHALMTDCSSECTTSRVHDWLYMAYHSTRIPLI